MALQKKKTFVSLPTKPLVTTPVIRSEAKGRGTANPPKVVAAPVATGAPAKITYEQISARAYEIYLKRGFGPGDAVSDWAEAERQLKAGR